MDALDIISETLKRVTDDQSESLAQGRAQAIIDALLDAGFVVVHVDHVDSRVRE